MPELPAFRTAIKMALAVAMLGIWSTTLAEPLRVCSDPDNLPFSKSEGSTRGLYIELAELIGRRLGVPIEYVWYLTYNQRRALRNSLDGCDAYFALPVDASYKVPGAVKTAPFLDVRYAVVARPEVTIATIDDLKGKSLGVTHSSTPQIYFSTLEGFRVKSYKDTQEVVAAIEAGEVDAGVLWGPHVGFLNRTVYKDHWQLTPIAGKGLGGQVAIAVPEGRGELKEQIDQALVALRPEIEQLIQKYGFPTGTPLALDKAVSGSATPRPALERSAGLRGEAALRLRNSVPSSGLARNDARELRRNLRRVDDTTVKRKVDDAASVERAGGDATGERRAGEVNVEQVRAMFNSRCAHCHSQNGASPQPERDLRRLSGRYGDTWRDVARTTIFNGRSGYGMPNWGETLSKQEIENVIVFLETIQKKP